MQIAHQIRSLVRELESRRQEPLDLYEPVSAQIDYFASNARVKIFVSGNRAGKTLACAVTVAMALTGRHPSLPAQDGRCFAIAKDAKEIGEVLYRKLFRPGAFKIVQHLPTGDWQTYKHWIHKGNPEYSKARLAPPLVPTRLVKSISWQSRKAQLPELVVLHNGWSIRFLSSLGEPVHGVDLDLVWLDEDIVNQDWYGECSARLIDREGLLIWSATPQSGTPKLYELYEEALKQADQPNPHIEAFVMELDDNPYLTDKSKADFKAGLLDEEEILVRVKGQFAILGLRVFPDWNIKAELMSQPVMEIPHTWTRYAVIDPGRQVCAVLFAAVPPPDFGDYIYLYDELYIKNCTADILAGEMKVKLRDQDIYDFIIDRQGSRVKQSGDGVELEILYSQAFQRHGVKSILSGHNFTPSIPHKKAGVEAIRELMRVRVDGKETGTTRLRFFPDKCPNFVWEARHWNHKRDARSGKPSEDPEDRGRVHLMACWRYAALYKPKFVPHMGGTRGGGLIYKRFLEKMAARREMMGKDRINLGAGERMVSV